MSRRLAAPTWGFLLTLVAVSGCGGERRFPVRDPIWHDTDLEARSVPCRPDPRTPGKRICHPEAYTSSFAWDGADNTVFRPLARFFAVDPAGESVNVNSVDEVPDSSWFRNRIGRRPMTPAEIASGPCGDEILDPERAADGSWLIDQGKMNGANPGFRVRLPDGRKLMLKADLPTQPEKATAATAIATRLYHAAGWYAACDRVIYLRPSVLRLAEGLTVTDNVHGPRPFDRAALDELLAQASHRGDLIRFGASKWLPGRTIGPFTYAGTDEDDPGDVIRHEDRRDLRGARLMAAWLDHWDSREQNSMRVWMSDNLDDPDASPGRVLHYYMDLGDVFGAQWDGDLITRRMGRSYVLDFGALLADFVTFGLVERSWDRAKSYEIFGYFSGHDFDPSEWKGIYPNPAFDRMSELDGAWAARIIARFTDEDIGAAVAVGDFTKPEHSIFLVEQLKLRRDAILRRYFSRISPISDLQIRGNSLCGVDLARQTRVFPSSLFHYDAGGLGINEGPDGQVCVSVPRANGYRVVHIRNGQARGTLHAHVVDLGAGGLRLVGIERSAQ